ncbi:hypothetical protein V1520DRAFT_376218 [Lipomyces starkeyi]|uniref:Zn(2)-C6 fungal-type domain-containing protein n=1 Tax=Lipomyces starkeyi NRRL Y-11557 TaxID=675824 RepID=A0A1E3PUT8_LIPST|nr:hypothetical protein LIPSTDRAFT_66719 [Lipomyces starkeyi NRRL Y-11557]
MSESAPQKRNACVACTKAKRRCSKQTPACRRCVEKSIVCRYPAPRITPAYDLVFTEDGVASVVPVPNSPAAQRLTADIVKNPWFLSPSSWTIDYTAGPLKAQISFTDESLAHFINQLKSWLRQWTSEGRCPFIHANLWKVQLPDCVQDSFTALTAYQSKAKATEKMVLRIIEQRVNRLVEEQNNLAADLGVIMLDPATHLARTQALLIYKIIRLYDKDIRARAQAENHIDILSLWARQLWQSAGLTVSLDQAKGPLDHDSEGLVTMQLRTDGTLASTWQAWTFAESVRRTYLAATLTEAVVGAWAPCPGGITFTGGKGLWDASTPYAWLNSIRENRVVSIRCIDGERLYSEAIPSDVDEFTDATLIVSYGLEGFVQ